MKNIALFLPALFCLSCNLPKVEEGPLTFEQHFSFDDSKTVSVESVVEAIDGGFVMSGAMHGQSLYQLFLVKTSASGAVENTVTDDFGISNGGFGGYLVKVSDGYVVVGVESDVVDQIVVAKFKVDLSNAWAKTFGAKNGHTIWAYAVGATASGDIIVGARNSVSQSSNPFFLKINPSTGALLDSQTVHISSTGFFLPASIAQNGSTLGVLGYNGAAPFFMKIDENLGTQILFKDLPPSGNNMGILTADGADGFLHMDGTSVQPKQAYIEALDGNGGQKDYRGQFAALGESSFLGGVRTPGGKYVPCGFGKPASGGDAFGIAALIASNLGTELTYEYHEPGKSVEFTASSPVSDGGYILAGNYDGGKEILLVKLNDKFKLN